MARINKVEDVETIETPVEEVEVEEVAPVKESTQTSNVSYSIKASFKTRTVDGDRVTHKYQGVGKTIAEALASVVGDDEDLVDEYNKPFPVGINMLVNATVRTSAGYEFSRALAPHVARSIFETKNATLFIKLFSV